MISIFEKGFIKKIEIKNRIVMSPISIGYGAKGKKISEDMIRFYTNRAKEGVGLIILGCIEINDYDGAFERHGVSAHSDEQIEGFEKLAKEVHTYGSKVIAQIGHPGSQTISYLNKSKVGVSPSAIKCEVCRAPVKEMTAEDIKRVQQEIIEAILRLEKAGLDGVELHGAHGYLINQFFSSYTNQRTDKYGGSVENRCRFVEEIMEQLKKSVSAQFVIGIRVSVDEYMWMVGKEKEGIHIEEGKVIAKQLEKIGMDYINVSSGIYETTNTIVEPISYKEGWRRHLSKAIKETINIPVIAASAIRTPKKANEWLQSNEVDFVALGRALVADEKWVTKAKGNKTIRPCISCMHCLEIVYAGKPMTCAVNANVIGNEIVVKKATNKEILVIGAGPAGLEASVSAAICGHEVVLLEKDKEIGGQLKYAKRPPGKEVIGDLLAYYKEEIDKRKIDLRLECEDIEKVIEEIKPWKIIVANGSAPLLLDIEKTNEVITYESVLDAKEDISNQKIAILGSGMNGLEMAHYLGKNNNRIDIYEIDTVVGRKIYSPNKIDILRQLEPYDINFYINHEAVSFKEKTLTIKNNSTGIVMKEKYDYLVISVGARPNTEVEEMIRNKNYTGDYTVIGDASRVGRVYHAVRDGSKIMAI